MAMYVFDGLTYSYLKECTTLLDHVDTLTESLILLFFCTALALLFSALPLSRLTGLVSNLPAVLIFHTTVSFPVPFSSCALSGSFQSGTGTWNAAVV
ncbi:MAG: hypothetical protein V8S14_02665 [Lachnospiraceae bacterium]